MRIKIGNVSRQYSLVLADTLRCQCLRYQEFTVNVNCNDPKVSKCCDWSEQTVQTQIRLLLK